MTTDLIEIKTDLISAREIEPFELFTTGGTREIVDEIERLAKAHKPDLSTATKRKEIASMANKVARSKTFIDAIGKELVADIKEQAKCIDAERKRARDRLDELKEAVRKPLTDWEAAEEAKQREIEECLSKIALMSHIEYGAKSDQIKASMDEVKNIQPSCGWGDCADMAEKALKDAHDKMGFALEAAIENEKREAELEALRSQIAQELPEQEAETSAEIAPEQPQHIKGHIDVPVIKRDTSDKAAINNGIVSALQEVARNTKPDEDLFKNIVRAMAKGEIPHVTINY